MKGMEGSMDFPKFGSEENAALKEEQQNVQEVQENTILDEKAETLIDALRSFDASTLSVEAVEELRLLENAVVSGEIDPVDIAAEVREFRKLGSTNFEESPISPARAELYRGLSAEKAVEIYLLSDELLRVENSSREESAESIEKKTKMDEMYEQLDTLEEITDGYKEAYQVFLNELEEEGVDIEENFFMYEDKDAFAELNVIAEKEENITALREKLQHYMNFPPEIIPLQKIYLIKEKIEEAESTQRKMKKNLEYLKKRAEDVVPLVQKEEKKTKNKT